MTVSRTGVVERPAGSDRNWPEVGFDVHYTVTQPIYDTAKQVDSYGKFGWKLLGIVGNKAHLQAHGDHTPWSVINGVPKLRGWIYALDFSSTEQAEMNVFERWLVATCQSDYPTRWIQFFNINGRQYDNAGFYQGASTDQHCHISAALGAEHLEGVRLFADYSHVHDPLRGLVPGKDFRNMAIIKLKASTTLYVSDGFSYRKLPNMTVANQIAAIIGADAEKPVPVTTETLSWMFDLDAPVVE